MIDEIKINKLLRDDPITAISSNKVNEPCDLLEHDWVAECVFKTIQTADEKHESPCIAVFGPWGSGKTGILNLVKDKMVKADHVWVGVDAWHNQRNDLVILEMIRALAEKAGPDVQKTIYRLFWAFCGREALSLIDSYFPAIKTKEALDAFEKSLPKGLPPSREQLIKDEFKQLSKKIVGVSKKRLVIVIDNLDRCRPEAALNALEAVFLISQTPNCAFVIAADQQVLVSFLDREYKDTNFSGTKYLEKVFPYYFRVPDPWVAWQHSDIEFQKDEILKLLNILINEEIPWRKDEETFKMIWHYLSQPRALRNPRRIKRILRRVLNYEFCKKDLKNHHRAELSQCLLFLVIVSDLWPQVYEFFTTTSSKGWLSWLEYMANPKGTQPVNGVLMHDLELQDFIRQVKEYNDDSFDDTAIGDQEELWPYMEDVAKLGL